MTLDPLSPIQRREFLKTAVAVTVLGLTHTAFAQAGGGFPFLSTPAESVRLAAGHLDATAETVASAIQAAIGRPIRTSART